MKKAFFFDIDGTLIDNGRGITKIPDTVIHEIRRLKERGHMLAIATGRPKAFIPESILSAGFDGFVFCNGGCLEYDGSVIGRHALEADLCERLIRMLENSGVEYVPETNEIAYLEPSFRGMIEILVREDINQNGIRFEKYDPASKQEIIKIECRCDSTQQQAIADLIDGRCAYDTYGTDFFMEIYGSDYSKESGIVRLCEFLNISKENIYAFGDGTNDLGMIRMAGHGVAMANACEELKKAADEICGDIAADGLAEYLRMIE